MENQFVGREVSVAALPVSPGVAIGRVLLLSPEAENLTIPEETIIDAADAGAEIEAFRHALAAAKEELTVLRDRLKEQLDSDESGILDAHLLMIEDRGMIAEVERRIEAEQRGAAWVFYQVIQRYLKALAVVQDDYLRERIADLRDIAGRVLAHLANRGAVSNPEGSLGRIIVASGFSPSLVAGLDRRQVAGLVSGSGSTTSHAAILARSFRIPAVAGIPEDFRMELKNGDLLIVDGFSGRVILHPAPRTEEAYRLKGAAAGEFFSSLLGERHLAPETVDGFRVRLAGNLESVADAGLLNEAGGDGVGLLRTEFMFINRNAPPEEDEQVEYYRQILRAVGNRPVVVRTLDVGGDKLPRGISFKPEENPVLGLRGIRLALQGRSSLLRTQLRALLRAGVEGPIRVLLPMVSTVEEVRKVRELVVALQADLSRDRLDHLSHLSLGVMIETPSAALVVEHIAPLVDFLSIGTNDLVQYTLAVDRGNEQVAYLNQPTHPAILRLIRRCVEAGQAHNIPVCVCGQMAADPELTPLLIGLGVQELSMAPDSIGSVRQVIRGLNMRETEAAAQIAMNVATAAEALNISRNLMRRAAPKLAALTG